MKTTIELPDSLLRRAKATAAMSGISMRQLLTEAMEQRLSARESRNPATGWRAAFGKASKTATRSVDKIISEEFEKIDPKDWK